MTAILMAVGNLTRLPRLAARHMAAGLAPGYDAVVHEVRVGFDDADLRAVAAILAEADPELAGVSEIAREKLGPGLAGPALVLTARVGARAAGVAVVCGDRLRLLITAAEHRRRGIGGALLDAAEGAARAAGHAHLSVADEAGNYVTPGIDERHTVALEWLSRRGYVEAGCNESLVVALRGDERVGASAAAGAARAARERGYRIARATLLLRGEVLTLARQSSRAWAFELARAFQPPVSVWLAVDEAGVVAFAAHDANNRGLGAFGPAMTRPEHRGRGLGRALLLACLREVAGAGHRHGTISWIGPRSFYDRVVPILATRRYRVFRKPLRPSPS